MNLFSRSDVCRRCAGVDATAGVGLRMSSGFRTLSPYDEMSLRVFRTKEVWGVVGTWRSERLTNAFTKKVEELLRMGPSTLSGGREGPGESEGPEGVDAEGLQVKRNCGKEITVGVSSIGPMVGAVDDCSGVEPSGCCFEGTSGCGEEF